MGDAGVDLLDAGRMICSVNEACSVMWLSPFSLSHQSLAKNLTRLVVLVFKPTP
jgi:hypothetical protein